LLGYSREELVSSVDLSDIHPHDLEQYREFLDLVQSDDLGRRGDFQCVTKDGEPKKCEISVSSREIEEDRYIISTVRDISERKDYEQRLEQFASVVSHDLRNPLNVAEGRLALAQEECDSEHLDGVENAHDRMWSLIDDLLNLTRDGESITDKEPVGLSAIVNERWETVKTDGSRLDTTLDGTILANKTRVRQMFENLFRNAVEHGGDEVTVTVGKLKDGFFVEDDGAGIDPDDRQKVFDTDYSTTDEGTGLGLSIVKEIAETHDWQIRLSEGSEGGARFEFIGVEFTAE
jgi:signal transduction histidine kinase